MGKYKVQGACVDFLYRECLRLAGHVFLALAPLSLDVACQP